MPKLNLGGTRQVLYPLPTLYQQSDINNWSKPCVRGPQKDLQYDVASIVTRAVKRPGLTARKTYGTPIRETQTLR